MQESALTVGVLSTGVEGRQPAAADAAGPRDAGPGRGGFAAVVRLRGRPQAAAAAGETRHKPPEPNLSRAAGLNSADLV